MNFSRQIALFKQAMQTDGNSGFQFLLKLLMMILSFLLLIFADIGNSGAKGLYMLQLISSTNLFFVTVATLSLFCTSVTEEKEHNTLGVLLMTGISPFGFLMGKIISRLYIVMQLILLQVPLIVVARTMGGLSMDQILAHLVYFFSMILIMSQIGMFFSIISNKSSSAIAFTGFFLALLAFVPCSDSATFISYYFKIFETAFTGGIFDQPVWLLLIAVSVVFAGALMVFSRFTYDEGSSRLTSDVELKSTANRARYRKNPIFEKDFRYYSGNRLGMAIRVAVGILVIFAYEYLYHGRYRDYVYALSIAWFYGECFYYSQVMIKMEKKFKTLVSLGTLPYHPNFIMNQKYKAFAVSVMPSVLAFLLICLIGGRELLPSLVQFLIAALCVFSHFLISVVCSLVYDRMSLVISVLYILLYSLTFFFCPMGWLLFLPSLVILSVNVYEKFTLELSKG